MNAAQNEPQTLHEMLRILDVASTLRRERERAVAELDQDLVKARLRERLRAAADEAGDPVTDAEIDAAIEQYYGARHAFREPPRSWRTVVAHLWVRRVAVGTTVGVAVAAVALWFVLVGREGAPFAADRRAAARASAVVERVDAALDGVDALAVGPAAREAAAALRAEAASLVERGLTHELPSVLPRAAELRQRLADQYEVRVVSRPGERSGIDAYFEDAGGKRVSGYYLIVEAVGDDGQVLSRTVRDAEHGDERAVRKWGEQVPEAVYERVAADKQADGIVDDALFARKRRGHLDEEVVMRDAEGAAPLPRGRRITRDL